MRPSLETPPCAVAVAGAFLFVVAGARCTALGQNSTFHHGGDVVIFIKKVSFGLLASILLRTFTSLNQPITRRAIVIYCYDAPRTRTLLIEGATIFSVPTSAVKREFQKNFIENKKKTKKLEQENEGKLPGTFMESQGKQGSHPATPPG